MIISVIIPTWNRPEALRRALAALARSDYPTEQFEVVVVDDGGSAELDHIIVEARDKIHVTFARQPNGGPGSARNAGARLAGGCIFAFIDDDCEPVSGWLRELEAMVGTDGDVMAGGSVVNGLPDNPYAEATHTVMGALHRHFNRDAANGRFFPSNNFAVPARLYRQIGGFDEGISICGGEDREYCDRWLRKGFRMVWATKAIVSHSHEMSLEGYLGQHFRYGRGALHFARARLRQGAGRVPFEGWRFHIQFFLPMSGATTKKRTFLVWALIGLAQWTALAGYCCEWGLSIPGMAYSGAVSRTTRFRRAVGL